MMIDVGYGHRLAVVSRTLPSHSWTGVDIDLVLRQKLDACLAVLDAVAVIAQFPEEHVTLAHAAARSKLADDDVAAAVATIEKTVRTHATGDQAFHTQVDELHLVVLPITDPTVSAPAAGFVGLVYDSYPSEEEDLQNVFFVTAHSAGALLFQALQQRTRLFLPFAPRFAEFYWRQSSKLSSGGGSQEALQPPWQSRDAVRTVSLGFDLRKSTFCMENADNLGDFAAWLTRLVVLLTRATHMHGGVFDKFTGDGVLVHFVEDACERVDGRSAVAAAVDCALVMQAVGARHMDRLREFLRIDSEIIGGAIGIDAAPAHWYLDVRHNPMIIGRGVVNACRLMDSSSAGAIRLTNIAYRKLPEHLRKAFRSVAFVSKEFEAGMKTSVWELESSVAFPNTAKAAASVWSDEE